MKKYSIFIALAGIAALTSCNKLEDPDSADFNWYLRSDFEKNLLDLSKIENVNPSEIELSDEIVFVAKGSGADSYVVWPGQPGNDYTQRDLTSEQISEEKNNVSLKSTGVALSSVKNGYHYKTFTYSAISPAEGFQIYGTARNYDYASNDYSEVKAGPYTINVIDSQVDLWDKDDPMNSAGASKYDITIKIGGKTIKKSTTGTKGFYTIDYERPGIVITAPQNKTDYTKTLVIIHANNCTLNNNGVGELIQNQYGNWEWTVDLSSEQMITLASQSAAPGAGSGDPLTKDYYFRVVDNPDNTK